MVEVPGSSPVAPTISHNAAEPFSEYNSQVEKSEVPLSKSEATRAKLLECTVQELLVTSADQIGFTAVARRAKLSTGALYARYENSEEMLIDVWNRRCEAAVMKFVRDATESSKVSPDRNAEWRVIDGMKSENAELMAGISIMIVARRNETLSEVVRPSIDRIFAEAKLVSPAIVHVMAYLLGELISSKGFGSKPLGWEIFVSNLLGVASRSEVSNYTPDESVIVFNSQKAPVDEIEDFDERLFAALVVVIGATGVERATVSRIARSSSINPATIYQRFESKKLLIRMCVDNYLSILIGGFITLNDQVVSRSELVSRMVGQYRMRSSKIYEVDRRFRLECLYAAWFDKDLGGLYAGTIAKVADYEVQFALRAGREADESDDWISFFNKVNGIFGYSLLNEYGLAMSDDDRIVSIETGLTEAVVVQLPNAPKS